MRDESFNADQIPGWILHQRPQGEASLLLHVFTLHQGRLLLSARSARRAKPAQRVLYQSFRPLLLSWAGQSEIPSLRGIEDSGAPLTLDDTASACGWYMNELLLRLLGRRHSAPELFSAYGHTLAEMAGGENPAPLLRRFELAMLDALGLMPDFAHCIAGGKTPQPDAWYDFYPGAALAALASDEMLPAIKPDPDSQIAPLGWLADGVTVDEPVRVAGACLIALAEGRFDAHGACAQQQKRVLRALLRLQLGERPLQSRLWFLQQGEKSRLQARPDTDNPAEPVR